jgi:2,3-dihydroxybiphenyl 1,2-dioxygenase
MSWGEMELAYLGLHSTAPEALSHFLGATMGLMPEGSDPAGFRVDHKWRRLWVEPGPRNDAGCLGLAYADETAWRAAQERLRALGLPPQAGSAAECAARGVARLAHVQAPWGTRVELVTDLRDAATPFHSADFPDGFVTEGQGFGHVVFRMADAAEYAAARRFAVDGLGLRTTDWLRLPTPAGELQVTFLHCNARHHTLALACMPGPAPAQRLHHINVEVASLPQVGAAYERALLRRVPLANTLGQHANDQMVSFYAVSPDGWAVEIGATGRVVGADWNERREYDRISQWGHHPPAALQALFT